MIYPSVNLQNAILKRRWYIGLLPNSAVCEGEYWYYSRQNYSRRGGVSAGAGVVPFFRLNEQLVVSNRRCVYSRRDRTAHRLINDSY